MPTTPNSKLPYPASTDPADVPADLNKLALALDELAYAQITTSLTLSSGVLTDVVSSGAVAYDGSPVIVQFYSPIVLPFAVAAANITINLYDGATDLLLIGQITNPASSGMAVPVFVQTRLTPTAATHTYRIRAQANGGNGTIGAGGTALPAYIRVRRA